MSILSTLEQVISLSEPKQKSLETRWHLPVQPGECSWFPLRALVVSEQETPSVPWGHPETSCGSVWLRVPSHNPHWLLLVVEKRWLLSSYCHVTGRDGRVISHVTGRGVHVISHVTGRMVMWSVVTGRMVWSVMWLVGWSCDQSWLVGWCDQSCDW